MYLSATVSVACRGVKPKAVVISAWDSEKEAVRFARPSLVRVNNLLFAAESVNVIPVT